LCFAGAIGFYKSQNAAALKLKKSIKHKFVGIRLPDIPMESLNLPEVVGTEIYENNRLVAREDTSGLQDIKKIYVTKDKKQLIDYAKGYIMDFPPESVFDFSYGHILTSVKNNLFTAVISREYSPYEDVDGYIDYYLNRFINNPNYIKANNITYLSKKDMPLGRENAQIISVKLNDLPGNKPDGYTFVTIKTNTKVFYRMLFKYSCNNTKFLPWLEQSLSNFKYFKPAGRSKCCVSYSPIEEKNYSEETKELYEAIINSRTLLWGIFTKDIYDEGINKTVPKLEQKLEYNFSIILSYIHYKDEFPIDFMQKNYDNGKIVELTYQMTESNNEDLFGRAPALDIYRGLGDFEIRTFAKAAKRFGQPFLFRLNNEMNSDWTSYSGIVTLSDPEIFIDNWRRCYKIFKEEGVNNAIWIFNPNDRSFPPCDWNNFLAYYPGNEYVDMIGITGYNTGTYYKDVTAEHWREFKDIYDEIEKKFNPLFGSFPWIITEFASSSFGGDKVKWIDRMFLNISKYKNIKIAVWFSYADYDFRPGKETTIARPYWLDETPQTADAFMRGLKKSSAQKGKIIKNKNSLAN